MGCFVCLGAHLHEDVGEDRVERVPRRVPDAEVARGGEQLAY
jgi:hypothetical protein